MSALSFTSPLLLAALLTLPAIWLILRATPPSPKTIKFPPFLILRQLTNKEETPDKTPWWLLLLRLLLAALLIVGLAGPVLNAPPPAPGGGPIAIIIDDGWAAAANWKARRDALAAAASQAAQSDRPIFVVTTAPQRAPAALQPLTGEEALSLAETMTPKPWAVDRGAQLDRIEALSRYANGEDFEIKWLSDGVASPHDDAFASALSELGAVALFSDRASPPLLRPAAQTATGLNFTVERLAADAAWEGAVIATARDGRELARMPVILDQGEARDTVIIELPLSLRNELSAVRLENIASAAAVQLIDARDRRVLIGLVSDAQPARNNLLSGAHYIRQALNPYAEFMGGALSEILTSDASIIILDDVGAVRGSDADALRQWVEAGGVLIRFAGPVLAEAAQDGAPPLLPVPLRGGGRAFGGALTWETPQRLDQFPENGPFADLTPPEDVFVRRQILAQPGGETTARTWARLEDGTPLVTGAPLGQGAIALFHIAATPQWSDLPVSGVFIDMLRRLTYISTLTPERAEETVTARQAPLHLLDGAGRLRPPGDEDPALTPAQMTETAGPSRLPGLYGAADAPMALNVIGIETPYAALSVAGLRARAYVDAPPQRLGPPLFAAALALLLIDGVLALWLAGAFRSVRMTAAGAMGGFAMMSVFAMAPDARAQPLDPPIDRKTIETALTTRLAYVETGDPAMDALSAQALAGLSRELFRRTALEPGPPARVNLESDDLSVYPFLYWPIVPGAGEPSEAALANIENFIRFGGLILFDTRDDERAIAAASTPEGKALQRILSQLNIPSLTPVNSDHVLTRSFYLLNDLQGRLRNNAVWVAAETSGANDGVTPVIIGGRDWAGAWATDPLGRPIKPMSAGGERARELSYRAGVNIVMVAFTGNYKSDQVHTPVLLERLGR